MVFIHLSLALTLVIQYGQNPRPYISMRVLTLLQSLMLHYHGHLHALKRYV